MAFQMSTTLRNARLDQITTVTGTAGYLRLYTGTKPGTTAASLSGNTLVSEHILGTPFAPAASSGVLSPSIPANVNAVATGTVTFYRVYKSDGTTCTQQDDRGASLTMNPSNGAVSSGQPVQITGFTITEAGA